MTYEYAARIAAFRETEVRARVGGILLHRNFEEGSEVSQGQVLFEIDPDTYEAAVERAKAQVAQAQATYDQAARDATRAEELVKQKVQSTVQRDQAAATRDARAAGLKQAEAELRTAELNLQYTKVAAPISGLTSREAVSEGSLIGTDSSSSLLTTITQLDPIYVNFSYTDNDAQNIKKLMNAMEARGESVKDLRVNLRFGDGKTYPEQGIIDFTSPTLDVLTGTLGVRAIVANHEHHLIPGQFVRVTLVGLKLADATTVPEKALLQDGEGTYVLVANKVEGAQAAALGSATPFYLATRRAVIVERQLANRDWLLKTSVAIAPEKAMADDSNSAAAHQTLDQSKMAVTSEKVVGLREGELVITSGQFTIQTALAALGAQAPGVPVQITDLDGQAAAPIGAAATGQKAGQ